MRSRPGTRLRKAAVCLCGPPLAVVLAGCGILTSGSPSPGTNSANPAAASSPSAAAPYLVGSWKTAPTSFNGQWSLQALTVDISNQSSDGTVKGTLLYYGDGLISPTETVPVSGNIDGLTIRLSGQGASLTGTYSLTVSASISFSAVVRTASGTQNLSGVLYSM